MTDLVERRTRAGRFVTVWSSLGVFGLLAAGFVSWMVWQALDQPTHCDYETPCTAGTILSRGTVPLCFLWGFWCGAGVVAWLIGRLTAARNIRWGAASALLSGATIFVFGVFATVGTLLNAVAATHGR
jgi:hypothetical protein